MSFTPGPDLNPPTVLSYLQTWNKGNPFVPRGTFSLDDLHKSLHGTEGRDGAADGGAATSCDLNNYCGST